MKIFLLLFFSFFILSSCDVRLNNTDLAEQIIISMEEEFEEQSLDIIIDSLVITRESNDSNLYQGLLDTTECDVVGCYENTYDVKITYDGDYFIWEILE